MSLLSNLRIIADDYCFIADVNEYGVINSILLTLKNYSGDYSKLLLIYSYFSVVAHLPSQLFSIGNFVIIYILINIIFFKIFRTRENIIKNFFTINLISNIFITILIIGSFNTVLGGLLYLIGWGSVALGWTIPVLVSIIFTIEASKSYLIQEQNKKKNYFKKFSAYLMLFYIGGSNIQVALITFLVIFLLCIYDIKHYIYNDNQIKISKSNIFQLIFISICIIVVLLSPGTQKRRQLFENKTLNISDLSRFTATDFLSGFYTVLLSEGIFIMLFIGIFVGLYSKMIRNNKTFYSQLILRSNNFFIFISLFFFVLILTSVFNFFSYSATWHLIPAILFLYIGGFLLSISIGINIINRGQKSNVIAVTISLMVVLFIFVYEINQIQKSTSERLVRWNRAQPVPYDQITDLDSEWVFNCNNRINHLKINKRTN
jgi:hypothetical protein